MPVTIENIKIYEVSEIAKKLKAKTKDIENLVIKKKLNGQKIGNKYYVSENSQNIFLTVTQIFFLVGKIFITKH